MARGAAAPARRTRTSGAAVQHAPARKTAKPRRVSGPAKGRRAHAAEAAARKGAAAARTGAPARKGAPAARTGAPARKGAAAAKTAAPARKAPARKPAPAPRPRALRPAPAGAPLAIRVARAPFVRTLRARGGGVLDALLSGQGWIALVGVLLAGIVFFNVDLLQLNRTITGTNARVAEIKRENSRLRLDAARLGSSERIQTAAAAEGLVLPAPGDVRYLKTDPSVDARRAAKRIAPPDALPVLAPTPEPEPVAPVTPVVTEPTTPAAPADPAVQEQPVTDPAAGTTTTTPPATTPQAGTTTTGTPTG